MGSQTMNVLHLGSEERSVTARVPRMTPKARSSVHARIPELDGLRGIAVLFVVAIHYLYNKYVGAFIFANLWVGVDLFFVLSGFLITSILLNTQGSPDYFKRFYGRRIRRIFPPYYLVLGTIFLVSVFFSRVPKAPASVWLMWATYAYSILPRDSSPVRQFGSLSASLSGCMGIFWSLSVEETFYLLWAPLVRLLRGKWLLRAMLIPIIAAPLVRLWMHTPEMPEYVMFAGRMDTLAYGAVLAIWLHRPAMPVWRIPGWLAAGAALAFFIVADSVPSPAISHLWFSGFGLPMAAIAAALNVGWAVQTSGGTSLGHRLLRFAPLRGVGLISYTMYLSHRSFQTLMLAAFPGHGFRRDLTQVTFAFAATIAFSAASWYILEAPLVGQRSWLWRRKRLPAGGAQVVAAAGK